MPTVFVRPTGRRFHKDRGCPGAGEQAEAVDLSQVRLPRPCNRCYPDSPRHKFARRYCYVCDPGRAMPCEHNGGIKITTAYQTNYVGLLRDPGDEVVSTRYVWPDVAWLYEPLAS